MRKDNISNSVDTICFKCSYRDYKKINYEIADKKEYEVIEQNRAIVSNYDGKFVVMSCEIQDETIILKKGTYSLEDMTGVSITYHKYEKVICE